MPPQGVPLGQGAYGVAQQRRPPPEPRRLEEDLERRVLAAERHRLGLGT